VRPFPRPREGSSSHWSSVEFILANRLSRKIADARQKPPASALLHPPTGARPNVPNLSHFQKVQLKVHMNGATTGIRPASFPLYRTSGAEQTLGLVAKTDDPGLKWYILNIHGVASAKKQ
jgi:hypothetical protein